MMDSRIVAILKDMKEYEKENLLKPVSGIYNRGDRYEALNFAAFTIENLHNFYIDKDVAIDDITEKVINKYSQDVIYNDIINDLKQIFKDWTTKQIDVQSGNLKSVITSKGNLSLSYKTFIGKQGLEKHLDEIEIVLWKRDENNNPYCYTISSFEKDESNNYTLVSCYERLNDLNIDWKVYGDLVLEGYKYLNDYKIRMNTEDNNE